MVMWSYSFQPGAMFEIGFADNVALFQEVVARDSRK